MLLLALVACETTPEEAFDTHARPVLEARCASSSCHGVVPGETLPDEGFFVRIDARGRLSDREAARARSLERVSTHAPLRSTLLRVPLPERLGGGPHWGGALFPSEDDAGLRELLRWIEHEPSGGEDVALEPLERRFERDVLPHLTERCATGGCHGPQDHAFGSFGVPADPSGAFSPHEVRHAYAEARKHLDLWSDDPRRSRLVRKGVRPVHGGLPHRRARFGNFAGGMEGEAVAAIVGWAEAERAAFAIEPTATLGLVYVEGSPHERAPFAIAPGPVGSVLWYRPLAERAEAVDLAGSLHEGEPVEIRDPAVSDDGRFVAFSLRREVEARFALYEIELATRVARRLSPLGASYVQPAYAPPLADGRARVVAVTDAFAEGLELVAIDRDDGSIERLTFTAHPEVAPSFLATGKVRGSLLFATRRPSAAGVEGVLLRFPLCHDRAHHADPEYHAHFGASTAPAAPHAARDLPDGRQILILLPSAERDDDRGALAVLDRSLGPSVPEGTRASFEDPLPPLVVLDARPRFRDPALAPDGSVWVAVDEGIARVTIDDREGVATLAREELRIAGNVRSPVLVFARPPADDPHAAIHAHAPDARGELELRDVAVLDSLLAAPAPVGERVLAREVAFLRLVQARDERHSDVLFTLPLPKDRSAWLDVPADRALAVQLLDAEGMRIDRAARGYFARPGLRVTGGVNPASYDHACSGCHGASTGDWRDAEPPAPDAISSASITLSSHAGRDPRRPLAPVFVPDEPRPVRRADLEPLLRRECASCHADDEALATLHAHVDLEGARARTSPLVERLLGRELDALAPMRRTCPPEGASDELVRAIVEWIETGARED